jgi:hypothetical protein
MMLLDKSCKHLVCAYCLINNILNVLNDGYWSLEKFICDVPDCSKKIIPIESIEFIVDKFGLIF